MPENTTLTQDQADANILAAWDLPRPVRGSEDYWDVAAVRHEALLQAYNDMLDCLPAGTGLWHALVDASAAQELALTRAQEDAEKRRARRERAKVHNPEHINRAVR